MSNPGDLSEGQRPQGVGNCRTGAKSAGLFVNYSNLLERLLRQALLYNWYSPNGRAPALGAGPWEFDSLIPDERAGA